MPTSRIARAVPLQLVADDGDEFRYCSTCAFGSVFMPQGYNKDALRELHCVVEHVGPFEAGAELFRAGEAFSAIFAVRAGAVKTRLIDAHGREQVLGFYFPGELVGLNAIYPAQYPCDAVALDVVTLCRFSFPRLATLASRMPTLQQELFRLLSKDIGNASLLAGDFSADERLAAFLVSLSRRFAERGYSATRFHLTMSRSDIANYLRLATETVSRVLRRFRDQGLIAVERREVELCDPARLGALASNILRD